MMQNYEVEELFGQIPSETEEINGALYIPIDILESHLDKLEYSTRNFHYNIFKDGYSSLSIAASIEVVINYLNPQQEVVTRTFVGACNFVLASLMPNTHFLATAKSECVKNASSDICRFFGRGLNKNVPPKAAPLKRQIKTKPDAKIMQQFLTAVEKNDQAAISMLSNIYDIKTESNVEEV